MTPLIVIVGPTASGKSELAHRLALEHNGSIISADSRTVYRGMDIGTAKPSVAEQAEVPYYGIDFVSPDTKFTVSDFKDFAEQSINEIRSQGRVPILVGGTGLYIEAVLFGYEFRTPHTFDLVLEDLTMDEIIGQASAFKELTQDDRGNRRRLIKIIQTKGIQGTRSPMRGDAIVFGLMPEQAVQNDRIQKRVDHMFERGVTEETKTLAGQYGWEQESMTGTIYRAIRPYIEGVMSLEEAKAAAIKADQRYAKKQRTWLRRYDFVQWFSDPNIAHKSITKIVSTLL